MVWAFLLRLTILVFGIRESWRLSERPLAGLFAGPLATGGGAAAMAALELLPGIVLACAFQAVACIVGAISTRRLYQRADTERVNLDLREEIEAAGNALAAGAVFDGVVAVLCAFGTFWFASNPI